MSTATSSKNVRLLYGLLNGGVSILFTVLLYKGGLKWFSSSVSSLGFVLLVLFAVLAARKQKQQQGGYLEFNEALKTTFQVLVIGLLLSTIFEYILYNYIDVPFGKALAKETAERMGEAMIKYKMMTQEKVDEMLEESANTNAYTVGKMFFGFALRCVGLFVVALIVSAIVKRKRPMFQNTINQ